MVYIKKQTSAQKFVLLALSVFMLLSIYDFTAQTFANTKKINNMRLNEITGQISDTVKVKTEISMQIIESSAKVFSQFDDIHSKEALKLLERMSENSPFDRMWLTNKSNKTISSSGEVFYERQAGYLEKVFQGESGITDVMISIYNDKRIFSMYAPVVHKGKVIGMLQGVYETDNFAQDIQLDSFQGSGYCYIFQSDGNTVISSWSDKLSVGKADIYDKLRNEKFADNITYEKIHNDIAAGKSGNFEIISGDVSKFAAYGKVDIKNWRIITVIPKNVVADFTRPIGVSALILMGKLVIVFAVLLISAVATERKTQKNVALAYEELSYLNNNLPGGILKCTADEQCLLSYSSNGYLKMLGANLDEIKNLYNRRFINTVHPDDRERIKAEMIAQSNKNEVELYRYRLNTKSGKTVWVSDQSKLITENDKPYYYCTILDITETKKIETALKVSAEQYKIAISQTDQIVFEYNPETHKITYSEENTAYDRIGLKIDYAPEGVIASDIIFPQYREGFIEAYRKICGGEPKASCEVKIRPPERENMWMKISLTNIFDDMGNPIKTIGVMQEITKEKEAELRIKQAESHRDAIMGETIFTYEFNLSQFELKSLTASNNFEDDFYPADEYVMRYKDLSLVHPDERKKIGDIFSRENMWSAYNSGLMGFKNQFRIKNKHGRWIWCECSIHFMPDISTDDVLGALYLKNIDEQKNNELMLKNKAERDALTGLYDRVNVEEQINAILSSEAGSRQNHAFLIFDIDYFKMINDTCGHVTGDNILKQIASILNSQFRKSDILGRLGGDEFMAFINDIGSEKLAVSKAMDICSEVNKLQVSSENALPMSTSIGIAFAPKDGTEFCELYSKADKALYLAKEHGRNKFVVYNSEDYENKVLK